MKKEPIEIVDPIDGEITLHEPAERVRIRDRFLDDLGREIPDPRPMQPPIGYKKQPSMFELIREATAREVALYAANRSPETFDEADDFDIDDDVDPHSPWENDFDPPWSEVRAAIQADREARAAAKKDQPFEKPLKSPPSPSHRPEDPDDPTGSAGPIA